MVHIFQLPCQCGKVLTVLGLGEKIIKAGVRKRTVSVRN